MKKEARDIETFDPKSKKNPENRFKEPEPVKERDLNFAHTTGPENVKNQPQRVAKKKPQP